MCTFKMKLINTYLYCQHVHILVWQLGSSPGKDDLFPQTIVRNSPNGSVAFVSGEVEGDGRPTSNKISYYKDISNMTFEEQQKHKKM